jgi:hypothetical protein
MKAAMISTDVTINEQFSVQGRCLTEVAVLGERLRQIPTTQFLHRMYLGTWQGPAE